MNVEGMSCGHCKAKVEAEIGKIPGASAEADVNRGTVEVAYDENAVTMEQLADAVERAGYTAAA